MSTATLLEVPASLPESAGEKAVEDSTTTAEKRALPFARVHALDMERELAARSYNRTQFGTGEQGTIALYAAVQVWSDAGFILVPNPGLCGECGEIMEEQARAFRASLEGPAMQARLDASMAEAKSYAKELREETEGVA